MNFFSNSFLIFVSCVIKSSSSTNNSISEYNYEKINRFGAGRRVIPDYRRLNPSKDYGFGQQQQYPKPLPTMKTTPVMPGPYHNIFQGSRRPGDYRVYRQKFDFEDAPNVTQRYFCEARLNCVLTHLAVRTEGGIPILLRGGVGYKHFYVIARPHHGNTINGTVSAYCNREENLEARRYQYEAVASKKTDEE